MPVRVSSMAIGIRVAMPAPKPDSDNGGIQDGMYFRENTCAMIDEHTHTHTHTHTHSFWPKQQDAETQN